MSQHPLRESGEVGESMATTYRNPVSDGSPGRSLSEEGGGKAGGGVE